MHGDLRIEMLTALGTVISIQENPFPRQRDLTGDQREILHIVRKHFRSVFTGVSKQHSSVSENDSLDTIRVRPFDDDDPDHASIKQEDGPSLLFYYIFDNWKSSFGLIVKREHQYGKALEELVSQLHPMKATTIAMSLTFAENIDAWPSKGGVGRPTPLAGPTARCAQANLPKLRTHHAALAPPTTSAA